MLAVYSNPQMALRRPWSGRKFDGNSQIRPGGLGLHLIHQAMDAVEFTRKGLTNRLRLVKYFAQASDAP
jgi:anti-sigma regulatory factor (Ser/Thr protein kinase)